MAKRSGDGEVKSAPPESGDGRSHPGAYAEVVTASRRRQPIARGDEPISRTDSDSERPSFSVDRVGPVHSRPPGAPRSNASLPPRASRRPHGPLGMGTPQGSMPPQQESGLREGRDSRSHLGATGAATVDSSLARGIARFDARAESSHVQASVAASVRVQRVQMVEVAGAERAAPQVFIDTTAVELSTESSEAATASEPAVEDAATIVYAALSPRARASSGVLSELASAALPSLADAPAVTDPYGDTYAGHERPWVQPHASVNDEPRAPDAFAAAETYRPRPEDAHLGRGRDPYADAASHAYGGGASVLDAPPSLRREARGQAAGLSWSMVVVIAMMSAIIAAAAVVAIRDTQPGPAPAAP